MSHWRAEQGVYLIRVLRHTVLISFIALASCFGADEPIDLQDFDLDTISVCPADAPSCPKESCLDICVEQMEDPMDCPYLCNQRT